jgi:hypothetical protein
MKMYHGPWIALYSAQAAAKYGTCMYAREDGQEVEITGVYPPGWEIHYGWEDTKNLGIVVKFLRKGSRGILER